MPRHVSSSHHDGSCSPSASPSVHDHNLGQRRQHPHSSPSALPLHSRGEFDSGSLSDSGVPSRNHRSPRRSDPASSPSPHNVHLSPINARHYSPSSPNLSLAGHFSDGERPPSLLHPSRLDFKRLLSKPAAPSVNSTLSITSDSESNTIPRAQPSSNEAWPSKARMQVHFEPSSSVLPTESTELPLTSPKSPSQQRPRNLLRKRSGSKHNRAAVSDILPSKATTSSASASQPTTRSPPATSPRSEEFSTTTLQFVIASRAAVPAPAPSYSSLSKLTPAGAIAQAYKEQDLRRESLAATARAENVSLASESRPISPDSPTSHPCATPIGNPCYTVLGSSADRIVIMGSVEDKSCESGDYSCGVQRSGSHAPSASASASAGQPVKSLQRKLSARLRRGRPSDPRDGGSQPAHGDGSDVEHGHVLRSGKSSSDHGHGPQRSTSFPKVKGKLGSLRMSLDQRSMAVPRLGESLDGHGHHPMPSEMTPDVVSPSPANRKDKEKQQEDDIGAGGRLWRIVKRLSAGGLRDRFQTTSTPPPPVPAIPADFLPTPTPLEVKLPITPNSESGCTGAEPGGGGDNAGSIDYPDLQPSTSAVWPPNADGRSPKICSAPSTVPATPQGPGAISQPRHPSTSSSSPQSSVPASTHFFRSHSSRSSFSSMFCGSAPPLPQVSAIAQSASSRTRSRAKSISSSPAPSPSHDDLPRTRTRKRSSPDIPTFSVSGVVNNFISRRPSLVRNRRQHHQNISVRSLTRQPPEETSTPPARLSRSDSRKVLGRSERVNLLQSPGPSVQSHDSHSTSSTERPGSTPTPTISAGAVAGTSEGTSSVTRMTFRELGGTQRQALTSQEKEDKWDDLLKKSARAGGTIHLENGGLASDNIRFSSSSLESEVPLIHGGDI